MFSSILLSDGAGRHDGIFKLIILGVECHIDVIQYNYLRMIITPIGQSFREHVLERFRLIKPTVNLFEKQQKLSFIQK